jgi:thiol-disulfide isomerase/thioredoxin
MKCIIKCSIISIIFLFAFNLSYSQHITIEFKTQIRDSVKIFLHEIVGFRKTVVDSVYVQNAQAEFPVRKYTKGYYQIGFNHQNYVDIILNPSEPRVSLSFFNNELQEGISIIESKENKILWEYKEVGKIAAAVLQAATENDDTDEYIRVIRQKDSVLLSMCKQNPELYFSKIGLISLCLTQHTMHPLDCIDFNDEELINSFAIIQAVNSYLTEYIEFNEKGMIRAVDSLITLSSVNSNMNQLIFDFLTFAFASNGPDVMLEYLINNYPEKIVDLSDVPALAERVESYRSLLPGNTAPEFLDAELEDLISKLKSENKYILLHFWSPECESCLKDIGYFASIIKHYEDKAGFLSIPIQADFNDVSQVVKELKYRPDYVLDNVKWDSNLPTQYSVRKLPTYYLLDPYNKIVKKSHSAFEIMELFEEIK